MQSEWSDGVHKKLRARQRYIFSEFEKAEKQGAKTIVIKGPPGIGKTCVVQAIVNRYGTGHVIAPNNALVDQAKGVYPWVNALKGKKYYPCSNHDFSCFDVQEKFDLPPCKGCSYTEARRRARVGDPTYWNPVSFMFSSPPIAPVTIIDEVHRVPSLLLEFCGASFTKQVWNVPDNIRDEIDLLGWLKKVVAKTKQIVALAFRKYNLDMIRQWVPLHERVLNLYDFYRQQPNKYFFYYDHGGTSLHVKPLDLPIHLVDKFKQSPLVVLVSATVTERDISVFGRDPVYRIEVGSPIPDGQVRINYSPIALDMKTSGNPDLVAEWVREHYKPNSPTFLPCRYSLNEQLKPRLADLPGLITHKRDPKDKEAKLARFKECGGLFLASGMDEGIDLPGRQCEKILIPQLQRADIGSVYVRKMLGLPGGQYWYAAETINNTVQRVGRGTRSSKDRLQVHIGDPQLPRLFRQYPNDWPKHFHKWMEW